MPRLFGIKHPFRLLLYLEWILLGIAILAVFSSLHPPPPHSLPSPGSLRPPRIPPHWGVRSPLGVLASIGALGLLGLRLPVGSRFSQGLYTSLGFGLSWLAVLVGGRGRSFFPALLLIVVIRACLMFPWYGRLIVAVFAYASFLLLLLTRIDVLGLFSGKSPSPKFSGMPSELVQSVVINLTLNSAILFGLVLVFVLLLVGALVAEKQSRQDLAFANRRLRQYALLIEDQATLQERNRIAREIHDSVGHFLTAQSIQLENVAMLLPKDVQQADNYLQKARQLGREALRNVRQSVATLRTNPLQGQSLLTALAKLIQDFEQTTNIKFNSNINLTSLLPIEFSTAVYRIVQEALTNISRHSEATQVRLELREKAMKIYLELADNGRGFEPTENTTGFGLQGMRERAEALGGNFSVHSQPSQGCQIHVELPLAKKDDPHLTS